MNTRLLVLIMVLALVGATFAAPVNEPTTYDLLRDAYERGELSYTDFVIYGVYLVHEPDRIPTQYQGAPAMLPSGTPMLTEAFLAINRGLFTEEEVADLEAYMARPTDEKALALRDYYLPGTAKHYDTPEGNHRVWWTEEGPEQLPDWARFDRNHSGVPDYIEFIGEHLEYSYAFLHDECGYDRPPRDGDWYPAGRDYGYVEGDTREDWERIDSYIRAQPPGTGVMAYAQGEFYVNYDDGRVAATGHMAYYYDWAFNNYGHGHATLREDELKTTVVHEYAHITQFGIAVDEPSHNKEKHSVFMEEYTYPLVNALQGGRISGFMNSLEFGLTRDRGLSWYNSVIWNLFIQSLYYQDPRMESLVHSHGRTEPIVMAWQDYIQANFTRNLQFNDAFELIFRAFLEDSVEIAEGPPGAMGWAFSTFNRWNWFTGPRAAHQPGNSANNMGFHYYDDDNPDEGAHAKPYPYPAGDGYLGTRRTTGGQLLGSDYVREWIRTEHGMNPWGAPDGWGSMYMTLVDLDGLDTDHDVVIAFKANPNNPDDTKYWGGNYFLMETASRQSSSQQTERDYQMHNFGDKAIIRVNNARDYHTIGFSPHVLVDAGSALGSRYQVWIDKTYDRTPPSFEPSQGGMLTITRVPGFNTHFDFIATPNERLFCSPQYVIRFTDLQDNTRIYKVNGYQPGNDAYEFADWDQGPIIYGATWVLPSGFHGTADMTVQAADYVGNFTEFTISDFLSIAEIGEEGGVIGENAVARLDLPAGAVDRHGTVSILVRPDITGGHLETTTLSTAPTDSKHVASLATMSRSLAAVPSHLQTDSPRESQGHYGLHVVGYAYDVSGTNQLIDKATLRLAYDSAGVPEDKLGLYRWDDNRSRWVHVPAQFDRQVNEVYAAIDSYGVYAIGYGEFVDIADELIPEQRHVFALEQNFPNPYLANHGNTTINFSTESAGQVSLRVYDVSGRLVATVVDDYLTAGRHSIGWNGTNDRGQTVESGIYFYKLDTAENSASRRMVIVR